MQSMTIEQLRAVLDAGGIEDVTLKGQGGAFLVQITTRSGGAVLAKARSTQPRRFGNPAAALNVLREVGITVGRFDASEWNPADKDESPGNRGRAEAMRKAHQAAAYNAWLTNEIQASLDDPRPSDPNDEVMTEIDAEIAALTAKPALNKTSKKTPRKGA
jgi:hypothetical protein